VGDFATGLAVGNLGLRLTAKMGTKQCSQSTIELNLALWRIGVGRSVTFTDTLSSFLVVESLALLLFLRHTRRAHDHAHMFGHVHSL